jgi:hypothetical protein
VPINVLLDFIKAQLLMEVEKVAKAMTEIHAHVAKNATRDIKAAIQKYKGKTHVRLPTSTWETTCWSRNTAREIRPNSR